MSGVNCVVDAVYLSELIRENQSLVLKNCELNSKLQNVVDKVDFYSKLGVSNDYERGFFNALEMVKNFMRGK